MKPMQTIRMAFAAALAAAGINAHANLYTDLWWNPQESGWGANIVHQGETAFVTLFVYGADGRPTWYVAPAARTFAYDASGQPVMKGVLYRTQGPWHGGPFDTSKVATQPVGEMTIEPGVGGAIRLHYQAEGLELTKDLVRQTFDQPSFGSNYHGSFNLRQVKPGSLPGGTREYHAEIQVHIDEGQAFIRVWELLGQCIYRGAYAQVGKFARVSGHFVCTGGEAADGTFEITDLEITKHGLTGFLRTWTPANNQYGRFGGARF